MKNSMGISAPYPGLSVVRGGKVVFVRFDDPHRVLSTCPVNGGFKDDLAGVANHQMCESRGPFAPRPHGSREPAGHYLKKTADESGLPENIALLGTSVAMSRTAVECCSHGELTVAAVCTAGVGGQRGPGRGPVPGGGNGRWIHLP